MSTRKLVRISINFTLAEAWTYWLYARALRSKTGNDLARQLLRKLDETLWPELVKVESAYRAALRKTKPAARKEEHHDERRPAEEL